MFSFSKPYSKLYIVGDNAGWSVDDDAKDLQNFAQRLKISAKIVSKTPRPFKQAVHYTSQFSLSQHIYKPGHKISVDYYHGRPGPEAQESFNACFASLTAYHEHIARVRVSTKEMEEIIKSSGIAPEKVMRIPIGIDTSLFTPVTEASRIRLREKLNIPHEAIVIGSFQKDGVGWDEGLEPKLIKGPDIFIDVLSKLRSHIPNLFVLLSGPARGFVKANLDTLGIPYCHHFFKNSAEIASLYDALDLYLITSREEGGPKAVLQSMAKKIPLVTTEVGQAKDLVKHGENAMMANVGEVGSLTAFALEVLSNTDLRDRLTELGLRTAEEHSLENQLPLWKTYLQPLIDS